jgi:hypothetical protein
MAALSFFDDKKHEADAAGAIEGSYVCCLWHSSFLLANSLQGANSERTFIAVKPDGVQRGLVGDIIQRFERRGYKLVSAH